MAHSGVDEISQSQKIHEKKVSLSKTGNDRSFTEILRTVFRGLFRTLLNIYDEGFFRNELTNFKPLTIFAKSIAMFLDRALNKLLVLCGPVEILFEKDLTRRKVILRFIYDWKDNFISLPTVLSQFFFWERNLNWVCHITRQF